MNEFYDAIGWKTAVARDLEAAVRGGDAAEASMAVRTALLIEGVACRTK
jgi:hypothetical protein